MRRMLAVLALVLASCTTGVEPNPTVASTTPSNSTTTTVVLRDTTPESGAPSTTASPTTTTSLGELRSLAYEHVADISQPIQVTAFPDVSPAYLITKDGVVWALFEDRLGEEPVLDISGRVRNSGEQGLLSIAVDDSDRDHLYLHYSAEDGDTVVSRFDFVTGLSADPGSETVLLRLDQPASNHNGGMLQVVEGTLYLGLGDGGGAGDRFNNGQNQDTLLGGLVAIDPSGAKEPSLHFYGLRNPWRFWVDGGYVYIADVGQSTWEEITVTQLTPGQNLGWPITEGLHCYRTADCDTSGIVLPQVEIQHGDAGTCSISGGVVYRGNAIPELNGAYLYSDYCGGYLRSLRFDAGSGEVVDQRDWTEDVGVPGPIVGFGVDFDDEVYVMTLNSVLRIVANR